MRYYPNNWQAIADTPSDMFETVDFEEFMEWKMDGWDVPRSVYCMIRTRDCTTDKVREHIYSSKHAAAHKIKQLIDGQESEFTVCTHDYVSFMKPAKYITDKDKENYGYNQ